MFIVYTSKGGGGGFFTKLICHTSGQYLKLDAMEEL